MNTRIFSSLRNVLILFILVLSFFLTISFFVLMINFRNKNKEENVLFQKYRLLQINPTTGESKKSMIAIPELVNEKFKYYEDNKGFSNLISDLETTRYSCVGSCFCDVNNERRISQNVAKNGMFYLLSALSTAVAINQAKDHFSKDCTNMLSSTCPPDKIESKVDGCEEESKEEEEQQQMRIYICEGLCANRNYKYHEFLDEFPVDCKQIRIRDVRIEAKDTIQARAIFIKEHFRPHCNSRSLFTFPEDFSKQTRKKKYKTAIAWKVDGQEKSMCKATSENTSCFNIG